jgi:hypothetical protein
MKLTPNQAADDGGLSIDTASALFCVALVLLVTNVLPALEVGFLQDDYKLMDNTQAWGWNLWNAIQQDGYTLGFRPLNTLQHSVFWNLFGEHLLFHRGIRILVHFGFGWLLAYTALLLGASRLHAAVAVLLYFASTVTDATIFYWVMFTPSDILSLATVTLMLRGINQGSSPRKLALVTLFVAAAALYTKENGIVASGAVLLLTLLLRKRLTRRHSLWLVTAHSLSLLVYMACYWAFSSGKWMTLSEFSRNAVRGQSIEVIKGILISLGAPFSAVYLSTRNRGFDQLAAFGVVFSIVVSVVWLLWTAYGRDLHRIIQALRLRLSLGLTILLLVVGFLIPYLPGRWFEMRMLVGTFAMGTFFWGMVLGDALQACAESGPCSHDQYYSSLIVIVTLAALAAGNTFTQHATELERTAQSLRKIVRETQARGVKNICLVGFTSRGSLMRIGNAKGVIGYESKRQIAVREFPSITEVPPGLDCAVVSYDKQVINRVPLTVLWQDSAHQLSYATP